MKLESLENIEDDEMASKIASIAVVLKAFGSMLLDRVLSSPIKFARIFKFSLKLKKVAQQMQSTQDQAEKLDSSVALISMILKYRHTNPKEMDMIFDVLEEITQKYNDDPKLRQDILNIVNQNATK